MPDQIQDNLAALQIGALNPQVRQPSQTIANIQHKSNHTLTHHASSYGDGASYEASERLSFPRLQNRTSNVPPSDDERESMLDNARIPVLRATDPEMQLSWAQDALNFVDVATELANRLVQSGLAKQQTSDVEHQLRLDSMNIINFLADQQHPRAEFLRGMWYEFGKFGIRPDKKEASACYKRAASKGYARAEYRSGMLYETAGQPMQALQHYVTGESQGDSASCYRMGMMALLGQFGQSQDFNRGIHLIRHAANTADENAPQGAFIYGMLLARDLPQIEVPHILLPLDLGSALHYIEKSAYLGFSKAQLKMGSAYELCSLGCDFNPALSLHYNVLAARQGEPEAELSISKWFLCGFDGVFQKNDYMAYTYAERAAQSGLVMAEFALGYYHEIGIFVPVSISKALEWYEKAAAKGNKDASMRLEGISMSSTLSRKDHERVAVSKIKSRYGSMRGVNTLHGSIASQIPQVPQEHLMTNSVNTPPRVGSVVPYPADGRSSSRTPYPSTNATATSEARQGIGAPDTKANARASTPAYFIRSSQLTPGTFSKHDTFARGNASTYMPHLETDVSDVLIGNMPQRQRIVSAERPVTTPVNATTIANTQPQTRNQAPVLDIGFVAPQDPRFADGYVKPQGQSDFAGRRLQKSGPVSDGGKTANVSVTLESKAGQSTKKAKQTPKGPQTFEQMGFTNAKQESDCVSATVLAYVGHTNNSRR